MALQHPLTEEHCKCLDKVLEGAVSALELARACKDCGFDVSELESQIVAQKEMAEKLKAKFFPYKT